MAFERDHPVGKIAQKQSEGVRFCFVNSVLKLQCHVVKNYTPTYCFFGDHLPVLHRKKSNNNRLSTCGFSYKQASNLDISVSQVSA